MVEGTVVRVELPPEPVYFVNRDDERERALRAVTERRSRSRPLVLALSGPGGLGKTELAGLIARALLDRRPFADGVLSVDLDDFRADGVLDPGDVLSQLLNSLDVAPDQVQAQYAARCRQYWNRTSDANLVLLLDNARYASEVVPLLPASGDSVVIVTSHGPLHDLEAGTAVDLALPPLEERAATELLELIVRDHRLAADPEAARAVVRLCDGLPAALLESVRMTLRAESDHREFALRRQTYAEFLGAAETRILTERNGRGQADDDVLLQRALGGVLLEGPPDAAAAAQHLVDCLRRHERPDELKRAKLAFVSVAQECCRSR